MLNTQPRDHVTIREHGTKKFLATVHMGSRAMVFRARTVTINDVADEYVRNDHGIE